jgi:hypothetical protein
MLAHTNKFGSLLGAIHMKICILTPQMLKFLFGIFRVKLGWFKYEWEQDCPLKECLEDAKANGLDIFTFWQRFPNVKPRYKWYTEWDRIAVLDVQNGYNYWWKHISKKTRNMVRKAKKRGVVVSVVEPSERFARDVAKIYNESPMRRGKQFIHYGETWEKVYEDFIKLTDKVTFIGAYYGDELIGFAVIKHTPEYSLISQILSLQKHMDKAPNYALIDKIVELCASHNVRYIVYERMQNEHDPLGFFKYRNGFKGAYVPRYFIPLTARGLVAIKIYKRLYPFLYTIMVSHRMRRFIRRFFYIMRRQL